MGLFTQVAETLYTHLPCWELGWYVVLEDPGQLDRAMRIFVSYTLIIIVKVICEKPKEQTKHLSLA